MASKKQQPDPEETKLNTTLLSDQERACAHLTLEVDAPHAAQALGWSIKDVESTLALPHVQLYLAEFHGEFLKQLAQSKVRNMRKCGVTKSALEERLMQIVMMNPEETKGTVIGQVAAGKLLAGMMGYNSEGEADPLKDKTQEELQAIVKKAHHQIEAGIPPKSIN